MPTEQELRAYEAFKAWLPYYYSLEGTVPIDIRIWIAANKYPNAAMGCVDIVNSVLKDRKLRKEAQKALTSMQTWKEA